MADIGELVRRLLWVNTSEAPYANGKVRDWCHEAARALESQAAEIVRLRRRLEIDRVHVMRDGKMVEEPADLPESQDGIACRDETIRLQDKARAELRRQRDALTAQMLAKLDQPR